MLLIIREFRLLLSSLYEEIGALEQAAHVLHQGLKITPDNPDLYLRLSFVYDELGRKEDAVKAINIGRGILILWLPINLSFKEMHLLKKRNMLRRLNTTTKLFRSDPNSASAYYLLGKVLFDQKKV